MSKLRILVLLLTLLVSLAAGALQASAQDAVVHAVLFFSPTCGHCEYVINEVIPPLMDQYGNQLQIIGIDISQPGGAAFYQAAIQQFAIPDSRLGVPTLIINDTILVGSGEIPELLPGLIQDTIKAGGNDWPDIPGLKDALVAQGSAQEESAPAAPDQPLFISAFMQDPLANGVSVAILAMMIAVVVAVTILYIRDRETKILHGPAWIIPVLALIGLGVAGYMSYVEITRTDAICGPLGDCNTVQDSVYAQIFGVPIGIIGIFGYLGILAVWLVQTYGPTNLRTLATRSLWAMGWFGILFSIYLTFLEPFVIGATCAWCLSSAVVMTLIFWFSTGPAQAAGKNKALNNFEEEEDEESDAGDLLPPGAESLEAAQDDNRVE